MSEGFAIGMTALAVGMAALSCIGGAFATGKATTKAVESIARQPEASDKITKALVIGGALSEATAIYALLIAILLIFVGIK